MPGRSGVTFCFLVRLRLRFAKKMIPASAGTGGVEEGGVDFIEQAQELRRRRPLKARVGAALQYIFIPVGTG